MRVLRLVILIFAICVGGSIAVSARSRSRKKPAPETFAATSNEPLEYTSDGEGPMGISAQFTSNYFEHQAQYFTLPGPLTIFTADAKPWQMTRVFADVAIPFQPSGSAVAANYANQGFWRAGLEFGLFGPAPLRDERPQFLAIGVSYARPFGSNPGGLMVRDVMTQKVSSFIKMEMPYTDKGSAIWGLMLATYFDVLSYNLPPAATSDWLWNFEAGLWHQPEFQPLGMVLRLDVGTAFAFSDPTAKGVGIARLGCTDDSTSGASAAIACVRSGSFSGLKIDLSARGQVGTVRLLTAAHLFGFLSESYSAYSTAGTKSSTIFYFEASAEYRFWLPEY
jgi:hypothetical protein